MTIRFWGITDVGAVRAQNQDSYYLKPAGDGLVTAVVCDGMGGARAGNVASSLAVETASEHLESLTTEALAASPGEALTQAASVANDAIFCKAALEPECLGMGTTMVSAVAFPDGHITVLNIGDSRAYHVCEEGIAKVTRDHSVVEDLVHRGEITPEEARLHPQKNLITRCLGSESAARTDLYEVVLQSGEFLLLCTDGLSNVLNDQELLYEIIHGGEPETCCQRMLDIALSRGAPDNVTAVLIQMV
ncbi:Stp1/IreP family PP2C-type Ser/Thr phosphatase [Vermiculatibacterium agrestimuris]|uniref:Stp1/IreP family PP2C-type Ser/Thr phosphatase n=1 Tax=Vermiculatibacterium agrestimuris TaxID=2941519 RepID=UPI00203EA0FB|nr:Stp1/IreP family PP2C-type Ser/Thr phosphatase [Vermiculatibacterium agrestimuris]